MVDVTVRNRSHVLVCKKRSVRCARMEGVQEVRT